MPRFLWRNLKGRAHSAHNGLFTSGTLGRYCTMLNSVIEAREA